MDRKTINITIVAFTLLGILCISSGLIMPSFAMPNEEGENIVELTVIQERIKTNEIKPKNLILEINQPLSTNIKDFLYDIENIEEAILNELVLDTSSVDIHETGTYTYIIIHGEKKYTGMITIREAELPRIDITLKNLSLPRGSVLPTNISDFIVEDIPGELLALMRLDLTNVNVDVPSVYQYTLIYNGRLFTGTITIFEPQPRLFISSANDEEENE